MNNEQNINNQDNKSDLKEKDFHEIVMKQYELINSQFNTIRQMQIDQEERDAEFDLSRLIPGFLRKEKGEKEKNTEKCNNCGKFFSKVFNFCLLAFAKNFILISAFTIIGLIYGCVIFFTSEKMYESKIKFASGALTNSFFSESIEKLGVMAKTAPDYLATKLNLSKDEAAKIKDIKFNDFTNYKATKKRIVNDSTIEEYDYYPFFEVTLYVKDNAVLDNAEKAIFSYLNNNSYITDRLLTMSAGIKSQLEDLKTQTANMDSLTKAAISRLQNSNENQYFIKETGLEGKGIILNQGEPISGIIKSILDDNKKTSAKKGLLTEQLSDITNDKFKLVESHSINNAPAFPKITTIILYCLEGLVLGFFAALLKIAVKKLKAKAAELEKTISL